ncbi:uncharacterized protein LOC117182020 [Belonocnema kinseyi]|uniref:uncharacterized protein LOC117182020 n=1 Tax=Belonocnema kinseyi TaxID=2817044 RepID=UPI00143D1E77|nr:uncharacterized protein LOC117182020 [Belonocnema kinseyi]
MSELSSDQKPPTCCPRMLLVFYPNECFICKATSSLKRCSRCNMISYCGKEHQMQHWKFHKDICKEIFNILKEKGLSHIYENFRNSNSLKWQKAKKIMSAEVQKRLERPLADYEKQMFKFPRACFVCHVSTQEALINCPECTNANFCQKHPTSPLHDQHCPQIQECHKLDLAFLKENLPLEFEFLCEYIIENTPVVKNKSQKLPTTMKEYLEKVKLPEKVGDVTKIHLGEFLSIPLTILNAFQKQHQPSKLVIHVDGLIQKLSLPQSWEILLHLMPHLNNLKIVLTGYSDNLNIKWKVCDKCRKNKKKLMLKHVPLSYDQYEKRTRGG